MSTVGHMSVSHSFTRAKLSRVLGIDKVFETENRIFYAYANDICTAILIFDLCM